MASAGQRALDPVQVSAASQRSTAGRQTVVDGRKASAGQAALDPVQVSAASQRSTAGRQTVVDGWKASAGHVVLDPVQVSATSHGPADARHTVPLASAVKLVPALNVSLFVSTPTAPISSSTGCAMVAVEPEDGVVLVPVAEAVLSNAAVASPENSAALIALAATLFCRVTVMLSVVARAVVMGAEKMTVRTPVVLEPFVLSASLL